jgi:hypothetical protein
MREFLRSIDRLLRGEYARPEDLSAGRILAPARGLVLMGLLLGAFYGAFMGLYAGLRDQNATWQQLVACMAKVPLLFLLTLLVTYPSLYVFSALSNSRLGFGHTLRLLLAAVVVDLALLASFGPVTAFFTFSTESYAFMVLLNVTFFAIAGFVGLGFVRRALNSVFKIERAPEPREPAPAQPGVLPLATGRPPAAPEAPLLAQVLGISSAPTEVRRARRISFVWSIVYGVVGAQMGWILRPFIGAPSREFSWFRERESNFFEACFAALGKLLSID